MARKKALVARVSMATVKTFPDARRSLPPLPTDITTGPVSKPMLPARICRIKSGSRLALPYRPPPMQVGWVDRIRAAGLKCESLVARSKPTY
jgi:hypothetical protein